VPVELGGLETGVRVIVRDAVREADDELEPVVVLLSDSEVVECPLDTVEVDVSIGDTPDGVTEVLIVPEV
jgi:hypothetical protein